MSRAEIIERLRNDDDYYGEFGNQFLSNSHIGRLFNDPEKLYESTPNNTNFVVGGYFHTAVLEPHKLSNYEVADAPDRRSKKYKEQANGEILILKKEADNMDAIKEKLLNTDITERLIKGVLVDYEQPGLVEINGLKWKGKADILHHDEGLIVDLKTTSSLDRFADSASKFNYDSQAYIYRQMFGYDMLFLAVEKKTHQVGIFDCSPEFYARGKEKVDRACEIYKEYYGTAPVISPEDIRSSTL